MPKYDKIDEVLPELAHVLKEAIQCETLEIRAVDKNCSKFLKMSELHPEAEKAEFVVFSPHMRKSDRPFEHFVFVDKNGKKICHISGAEMELYGLLEPCANLTSVSSRSALRKA